MAQLPPDAPAPKTRRLGLALFLLYLVIYGSFVDIAAFHGILLATTPLGGVNLAILYGFALIILPLVLAVAYLTWAGDAED